MPKLTRRQIFCIYFRIVLFISTVHFPGAKTFAAFSVQMEWSFDVVTQVYLYSSWIRKLI